MHEDTLKALESIDASVYSADTFHDLENRNFFRQYVYRWVKWITETDLDALNSKKSENALVDAKKALDDARLEFKNIRHKVSSDSDVYDAANHAEIEIGDASSEIEESLRS